MTPLQNKIEEATKKLDAQGLAILFHNTYEGLAPSFGYETREDTKEFDPESKNGKLMIAVCQDVINTYINPIATLAQEEARKEMVEDIRRIIMSESPMSETTSVTQLLEDIERYAKSKDITLSNNTQL